jgi:hypothetical protein
MTQQHASIYRLADGRTLVDTDLDSSSGWHAAGTIVTLPPGTNPDTLGRVVDEALSRSHRGDDQPGASLFDGPLLAASGTARWSDFVTGTRHVSVYLIDDGGAKDGIHITPTDNKGARGGFAGRSRDRVTLQQPTAAELGMAVVNALRQATS